MMKKGKYFIVVVIFCLVSAVGIFSWIKINNVEKKFHHVKKGMTRSDVVKILGEPLNTQRDTSKSSSYVETLYYDWGTSLHFKSDVPTVVLDSSSRVVLVIPNNE